MKGIIRSALTGTFINRTALEGMAWGRAGLFAVAFVILMVFDARVSGSESLRWPILFLAVYSIVLVVLLRQERHRTVLWVGGVLDNVTLVVWLFLLASFDLTGDLNIELMEISMILAVPLAILHFGVAIGAGIASAVVVAYFLLYQIVAGSPEGMDTGAVHASGGLLLVGFMAWVVYNLRVQEARAAQRLREVSALNRLYSERLGPQIEDLDNRYGTEA